MLNQGKRYIKDTFFFASDYIQMRRKYDRLCISQSCLNILHCERGTVEQQRSCCFYTVLHFPMGINSSKVAVRCACICNITFYARCKCLNISLPQGVLKANYHVFSAMRASDTAGGGALKNSC